jgi:protein arginine N-methyltransferase 1
MSLMLDEHRLYLSDRTRVALFRRAINAVVKPGDVVLDLCCGTGVLGMLAMKAGAARVYQIDSTQMIQIARDVARDNGYEKRAIGIRELASRANLPEKIDVAIADQLSHFGIGAGMPELFNDARRRLLKTGGCTIPRSIELFVAAVNFPEMSRVASFWDNHPAGLKMRPAHDIAFNTGYPSEKAPRRWLGKPARMFTFDLTKVTAEHFHGEAEIRASTSGVMHGLSGWFVAELAPQVRMTNSPFSKGRIQRRAAFLPIEKPVAVEKGDCLKIAMDTIPSETILSWKVTIINSQGKEKARYSHSTLKGMLLLPEDLAKTRPDFIPRLSDWGQARRSVVNLIDGKRRVAQIEQALLRLHPNLFPSLTDASRYVAEVLAPYALVTDQVGAASATKGKAD